MPVKSIISAHINYQNIQLEKTQHTLFIQSRRCLPRLPWGKPCQTGIFLSTTGFRCIILWNILRFLLSLCGQMTQQ